MSVRFGHANSEILAQLRIEFSSEREKLSAIQEWHEATKEPYATLSCTVLSPLRLFLHN